MSAPAQQQDASRHAAGAADGAVRIERVSKHFGDVVAVDDVSLDVAAGEFFALLGPSGSGKTTCLRMLAGFERPTAGRVFLGQRDVTDVPPFDRDVNTVFQDYALFPHMTVEQNVAYPLMVRRVPKEDRRSRVEEMLSTVRLEGYGRRRPGELSGGQRQRVALARALVGWPRVLLLDEPLGALDRKLREQMQIELKALQREIGITFMFVTHDQDEALTMSDRIAVFNEGRIEQVGTPAEIYEQPSTGFVAEFIGTSNLVEGDAARQLFGDAARASLRPERLRVLPTGEAPRAGEHTAEGQVVDVVYAGATTRSVVSLDAGPIFVVVEPAAGAAGESTRRGDRVRLAWDPASVYRLG
ncbi:MAG TPA: ABC transporter ATP-binding protein [Mycobacteriales bacterium]|nr:ABC transporter ATP-binding protein [Mycobacteriales bacterium]